MASIRHLIGRYYPKIVEAISADYARSHGHPPVNVSHWDPASEFARLMDRAIEMPPTGSAVPYLYAPDSQQIDATLKTIGTLSSAIVTTPSGTASIVCTLFWLASTNVRRLLIVNPSYFSVGLLAEALGFDVEFVTASRIGMAYDLPRLSSRVDAVWITNPLYCTTHYLTSEQLRQVRDLLEEDVYVIADESMTFPRQNAGSSLAAHRRFVGIYSPHKAIGVNGLKCSMIACDVSIHEAVLDIFDAMVGGLPLSTMAAMAHLTSENFGACMIAYDRYILDAYDRVFKVIGQHSHLTIDAFSRTNFVSAFVRELPAALGRDTNFLRQACEASAAIAYPAILHGYGEECGFGFRVNLTAVNDKFIAALHRWCSFLNRRAS